MNRTTLIAIAVFAVLAVGVILTRGQAPERGIERVNFSTLDPDSVDAIAVSGPNPVKLEKKGGEWKVASIGKDADASMVKRALEQLAKVDTSDLVTRSEARFEELGVSGEKAVEVVVRAGPKSVAKVTIGEGASGGSYILAEDRVFSAKGIYRSVFDREADQWLDRRLFRGRSIDDLKRVEVSLGGESQFAIEKNGGTWKLPDGFETPAGFRFDKNAARSLASTLVNLRARDVVLDAVEKPGVAESGDLFTLTFGDGDSGAAGSVILKLGAPVPAKSEEEKSTAVYASVDARDDETVTLLKSQADGLRKGVDRLRDMKVMSFDTAKAVGLEIQDPDRRLKFEKSDEGWTLVSHTEKKPDGFEFDPNAVERRVRAISNARASSFVTDASPGEAGLNAAKSSATVVLEDGTKARIAFGQTVSGENESAKVYVRGNADEETYLATEWLKNSLTGGIEGFKKQAAPPGGGMGGLGGLDPKALENLPPEVRESLKQQMAQQAQQQRMLQQLQAQSEP